MLSERSNLTPVANLLVQSDPATVLDIGVGFGNYGMIARAFLDVWRGRAFRDTWKIKIDGIEYYTEFKNPIYDYCYDHVFFGNCVEILPRIGDYDVIILMHILEHLPKEESLKFLKLAKSKTRKRIIVGTPLKFFKTGWPKYPKEEHQCHYTTKEYMSLGYQVITLQGLGILAWKDL